MNRQVSQDDLIYWNAVALFSKFEAKKLKQIADYFPSMALAWQSPAFEFIKAGIEEKISQEFIDWRKKIDPEKEWEKLLKEKINVITIKNSDYPQLLKEIYDPPAIIYYQGELKKEEICPLGIVGTRKMTPYGRQVCEELVQDLARAKITVVSGLALGIDGLAHKTTLKEKGRTLAVLGGGINKNVFYPKLHQDLAKKIIDNNGVIMSEYPFGFYPGKYTFPARNRIISGLCLGTLVVEAPIESGALITAKFALEQNREVFAVPGSIYSKNSIGCNWLIKLGAKPVTRAKDILEEFNLIPQTSSEFKITAQTQEEEILLKYLSREPIQVNKLIESSGLSSAQVLTTLSLMELENKVKNIGGGNYVLT